MQRLESLTANQPSISSAVNAWNCLISRKTTIYFNGKKNSQELSLIIFKLQIFKINFCYHGPYSVCTEQYKRYLTKIDSDLCSCSSTISQSSERSITGEPWNPTICSLRTFIASFKFHLFFVFHLLIELLFHHKLYKTSKLGEQWQVQISRWLIKWLSTSMLLFVIKRKRIFKYCYFKTVLYVWP